MTVTLYGIPSCDTVRKALAWLAERGVAHAFHDSKKAGVDRARLERWVEAVGWEPLLNRAGTTFRGLADSEKTGIDRGKAVTLMLAHPSIIRRPIVEAGDRLLVGFKPDVFAAAFPA